MQELLDLLLISRSIVVVMMTMTMMMMMKTYLSCILPGVRGGGCAVSCQVM